MPDRGVGASAPSSDRSDLWIVWGLVSAGCLLTEDHVFPLVGLANVDLVLAVVCDVL